MWVLSGFLPQTNDFSEFSRSVLSCFQETVCVREKLWAGDLSLPVSTEDGQ